MLELCGSLCAPVLGDVDDDGSLNIVDIVIIVDLVINNSYLSNADANEDGYLDILDILILVDTILN